MLYIPGSYVDLSKTDFTAARGAAIAFKSPEKSAYDIIFDFVEGRIISSRRIKVVFA
ncbi:hypothetical protein UFOVP253_19 [uncultured Caudovirales phage]|uniref:Uncharacterized protein n=1 Tax=uncultured Caudovirales phage TaxID=2100421 RepID=A0A6J5LEG4_9CAUD|nr:hypothetical protein UFOVP253_19 [uncultured Caudovirales phage]